MTWTIEIRQEAEEDIHASAEWYAQREPGLEERFLADLDACFAFILQNPMGPATVSRAYRQFRLSKFPFHVVYMVIGNLVLVMRVYHMKRDDRRKLRVRSRRRP